MPENNERICPFMSTGDALVPCTSRCKLHRTMRQGFECQFQELHSICWNTRRDSDGSSLPGGNMPPPD